jgi:hypothetical protein
LFPETLTIGKQGIPLPTDYKKAEQSLGDLADLAMGLSEFLLVTRPGGALGTHLGGQDRFAEILDPAKPMVFPSEGRMLAIGALAGVLKNAVAPSFGHLEETPGQDFGVTFHDRTSLGGRLAGPSSSANVAKILMTAIKVRQLLEGDADVPAQLKALAPQLDTVIQVGALTLGAESQDLDGGFWSELTPKGAQRATGTRALADTVAGLRAMTGEYLRSKILVVKLQLRQGWIYLDGLRAQNAPVATSVLWELLNLWEQTRPVAREVADDVDWGAWSKRFDELRARLLVNALRGRATEPMAL